MAKLTIDGVLATLTEQANAKLAAVQKEINRDKELLIGRISSGFDGVVGSVEIAKKSEYLRGYSEAATYLLDVIKIFVQAQNQVKE